MSLLTSVDLSYNFLSESDNFFYNYLIYFYFYNNLLSILSLDYLRVVN